MNKPKPLPIYTTYGITKEADGWVCLTIKSQGEKILSTEKTQPNLKAITLDEFKVLASKMFREDAQ